MMNELMQQQLAFSKTLVPNLRNQLRFVGGVFPGVWQKKSRIRIHETVSALPPDTVIVLVANRLDKAVLSTVSRDLLTVLY